MEKLTRNLLKKTGVNVEFKKSGPFIKEVNYSNGVRLNFVSVWIFSSLIVISLFAFLLEKTLCINSNSSVVCSLLYVAAKPFELLLPLFELLGK